MALVVLLDAGAFRPPALFLLGFPGRIGLFSDNRMIPAPIPTQDETVHCARSTLPERLYVPTKAA
ncbi:hypothetical protein YP76_06945 [Sphingobium chungbukense]|uniref:Uncharacterized protein n=1 Tax=Sphingobium chungbukense TaxID=56193 RepID=A0A0M3AS32_9SPHN|nr:hypothetical protein YP76_06945 [Sphingobium chungbukense]